MAWYEGAEPVIRKSPLRADSEPEFEKLAREPLATSAWCTCAGRRPALASASQHPPVPGTASTCSPTTAPSTRRTGSARCCRREWERQLAGTTDSERYFLLIMWRLAASGGDMVAAIAHAAADIEHRFTPTA